jgi:hypothetical protein
MQPPSRQWIHSTAAWAALRDEEVEAHGAGFQALGADAMADRLLGVLRPARLRMGKLTLVNAAISSGCSVGP